jgi:lipoate-protein ligase B
MTCSAWCNLYENVQIKEAGATVHQADRGGEVTFHGPGQWVCYPIFGLRDLKVGARAFVKGLENSMIATVGAWGLHAAGDPESSAGVWPPFLQLQEFLLAPGPPVR